MKPIFLAGWNYLKLTSIKLRNRDIKFPVLCLLSWNTRLIMKKTAHFQMGKRLISDGRTVIVIDDNASLKIGDHVYFNEGTMISCKSEIGIGNECLFGPNVKIFDNNHEFDARNGVKQSHRSEPIHIGNNCWIGANVVILKGSTIGDNCVIGAGCVVSGSVPNGHIVKCNHNYKIEPIR